MTEHWYRYEDSGVPECVAYLRKFPVTKHTPRGVWIDCGGYSRNVRFVLNDARKRYAYPTRELAWQSYRIRKQWQRRHLLRQLQDVETRLRVIMEKDDGSPYPEWFPPLTGRFRFR
jgi:hypothetical protein